MDRTKIKIADDPNIERKQKLYCGLGKRLHSNLKLYAHYVSVVVRSAMQYKTSFLLGTLGQFLVSFNVFLGIFFLFSRFSEVKGYCYSEVLLCYGILLMEFSLAECIARGFDSFHQLVKKGEFDRIMVRPRSPILQVLGSRFELTRVGRMIQALVMFVYGVAKSEVFWTCDKILMVLFMLIGGVILFSGIFMIYAALCFWTLDGLEFMNIFTDGAREYGKYPIDVYGNEILKLCTFVVPYALVQYYPLQYILGRTSDKIYMLYPFGTIFFFLVCYGLWRLGMKRYQSAGS
ncbi:MAG: ABC transporter permease [Lachnospiraceae bacterium]